MPDENSNFIKQLNQIGTEQQSVIDHIEEMKETAAAEILPHLEEMSRQAMLLAIEIEDLNKKCNPGAEIKEISES